MAAGIASPPASRSLSPAAVSRVRGGDARRFWLRDSRGGRGPGSPKREELLGAGSIPGPCKVSLCPQIGGHILQHRGNLIVILLKKHFCKK